MLKRMATRWWTALVVSAPAVAAVITAAGPSGFSWA